jgi:hypothetical protein
MTSGLKVNVCQLEDMMLSEVSQDQKQAGYMFSLVSGRQIQKINIYTPPFKGRYYQVLSRAEVGKVAL